MKTSKFPLRAIAILVAVFFLGSVFGAGLLMVTVKRRMQKIVQHESSAPRVKRNFELLNRHLERKLELTSEEAATVKTELNTTMVNIVKIRTGAFRDVRREASDSVDRISSQLPKEKSDKLRAMADKRLGPWGLLGLKEINE